MTTRQRDTQPAHTTPGRTCDDTAYPNSVAECIDDSYKFKRGVVAAVKRFARSKPWRGTHAEREAKLRRLHANLCNIYGVTTALRVRHEDAREGLDVYMPQLNTISMSSLSVMTYLHEFGHAIGKGERGTCRWSLNLFRRCFPKSFAKCGQVGHMLVRRGSLMPCSVNGVSRMTSVFINGYPNVDQLTHEEWAARAQRSSVVATMQQRALRDNAEQAVIEHLMRTTSAYDVSTRSLNSSGSLQRATIRRRRRSSCGGGENAAMSRRNSNDDVTPDDLGENV